MKLRCPGVLCVLYTIQWVNQLPQEAAFKAHKKELNEAEKQKRRKPIKSLLGE
jgi:hypothetical protein